MNKIIIALLLLNIKYFSQNLNIDSLCLMRGHIAGEVIGETALYCPPYLIETDSISEMVYPACNYYTYQCARCKRNCFEKEKERKVILWLKNKTKQ